MLYMLVISTIANIFLLLVISRFSQRLIQFDRIFDIVSEDITTNISYLNDMFERHVSTNAPEIIDLDRNLKLMKSRFEEVAEALNKKEEESE